MHPQAHMVTGKPFKDELVAALEALRAASGERWSDQATGRLLDVSDQTILRWRFGDSEPVPERQKRVLATLARETRKAQRAKPA